MRFHLIDRIDELVPGERVRGRKLASHAESFWERRGDELVMPRTLVLESLCQAGTWLIMGTTDRRRRAALLQVGDVGFTGDVHPGDAVILEGVVESLGEEMAVLSGRALVSDRVVMTATDIMCALLDADTLQEPQDSERLLLALTRA